MNAIPTKYAGVQFRSRLEARWAAFFDLCGWKWDYEPIDLEGYIPDFIVAFERPLLVEVKPLLWDGSERERLIIHDAAVKTLSCSWDRPFLIVGACLKGAGIGLYAYKTGTPPASPLPIGDSQIVPAWREAGNRVQWRAPA